MQSGSLTFERDTVRTATPPTPRLSLELGPNQQVLESNVRHPSLDGLTLRRLRSQGSVDTLERVPSPFEKVGEQRRQLRPQDPPPPPPPAPSAERVLRAIPTFLRDAAIRRVSEEDARALALVHSDESDEKKPSTPLPTPPPSQTHTPRSQSEASYILPQIANVAASTFSRNSDEGPPHSVNIYFQSGPPVSQPSPLQTAGSAPAGLPAPHTVVDVAPSTALAAVESNQSNRKALITACTTIAVAFVTGLPALIFAIVNRQRIDSIDNQLAPPSG